MLRIGFDAKRAFHNASGLGNYSRDLIQACLDLSDDWEIHAFNPKSNPKFQLDGKIKVHEPQGLKATFHPLWRKSLLGKLSGKLGLDIYHGLSNELPSSWTKNRPKRVVTIHDVLFDHIPDQYNPIDRLTYRSKTKSAIALADAIISVSKATARDLHFKYQADLDKIHIIPPPIHPSFFQKVSEEKSKSVAEKYQLPKTFLLTVGTPEPRKNQKFLAQVAEILEMPLVMVGKKTKYGLTIQEYFKDVVYLRSVPLQDLPALYTMAHAFVYASKFEGFGMPLAEAMACGTPVFCPDLPLFREVCESHAGFYEEGSHDEIINHLRIPLPDDQSLEKGRIFAKRYSREEVFAKLKALYQDLAE